LNNNISQFLFVVSPCANNPCENNGTCSVDVNGNATCTCDGNWNGTYCQGILKKREITVLYGIIFRLHAAREMADVVAQISLIAYLSFFQLIKLTHQCSLYIIKDLR